MSAQTETNDEFPQFDFDQLMDVVQHLRLDVERNIFHRMWYTGSHIQPLMLKIPIEREPSRNCVYSLSLFYHPAVVKFERVVIVDPFCGVGVREVKMIYTIGHQPTYAQALEEKEFVYKTGRMPQYPGGYCFQTKEDAHRRIQKIYGEQHYEVYGLLADWESDTYPSDDGWWRNLLVDSLLVDLNA